MTATYPVYTMDAQIENHLPLITSRLVFAPKVFSPTPTITSRMEFPSINIETRDDSPVPEKGGRQSRAGTPSRRATTPSRRTTTPSRRATTPKWDSTPRASARCSNPVGPSSARENRVTFDENTDEESLSSLTEDEDMDELEETGASEAEHEVISSEGAGEGLIPKPKGDVGRPGCGGYNLFKALGWNQKTYDSVLVSKWRTYDGIYISPITRYSSQGLLGISSTQRKAIEGRTRRKYSSLLKRSATSSSSKAAETYRN
jgi:hypothetical protein